MPSEYAELMNAIFRDRPWDASPEAHAHGDGDGASARRPPRTPKGVTVEKIDLNGLGGERLTKPGNAGWVLYVHGGGYMSGSARERREVCQYIADMHGRNVMSCNYRLAPGHLWPAQIDDTLAAWEGVLARGVDPADVIVAGESAGGTLALSLAFALKERGMAQPGGIMALSPSVTQAESLPSHSANVATDYLLRDAVEKGALRMVYGGSGCTEEFRAAPWCRRCTATLRACRRCFSPHLTRSAWWTTRACSTSGFARRDTPRRSTSGTGAPTPSRCFPACQRRATPLPRALRSSTGRRGRSVRRARYGCYGPVARPPRPCYRP